MADVPQGWEARAKPLILFRRFEFERYAEAREFLEALAMLSEETGIHPQNISFGAKYVNITLEAADGVAISEAEYSLAAKINGLRMK